MLAGPPGLEEQTALGDTADQDAGAEDDQQHHHQIRTLFHVLSKAIRSFS